MFDGIIDKVFNNSDFVAASVFCVSAGVGQLLHAVKKWADGEVDGIFSWVFGNIKRTISAVIGNIGGMVVFIQTGVLGPILLLPNGLWAIFLFGFMNGFTADSALNKSSRKEWTPTEREIRTDDAKVS